MRDFTLLFNNSGNVSVDWSAPSTGIQNVKQKLVNNMLTDLGTDEVVPARGTTLLRSVTGGGVYDLRSAQHALNFAALAAKRTVRLGEPEDALPADQVGGFSAVYRSLDDRTLSADLSVTTADGTLLGVTQQIL